MRRLGAILGTSAQLSPVASYEGRIVGRNIVDGDTSKPDYLTIPSNVYTVPALASVGHTEAEARDRGLEFTAKANDLSGWRSSMTHAETAAFRKS